MGCSDAPLHVHMLLHLVIAGTSLYVSWVPALGSNRGQNPRFSVSAALLRQCAGGTLLELRCVVQAASSGGDVGGGPTACADECRCVYCLFC